MPSKASFLFRAKRKVLRIDKVFKVLERTNIVRHLIIDIKPLGDKTNGF